MADSRVVPGAPGPPEAGASKLVGASLVVANLLPLWALYTGRMSTGDVFVVYWLENVAVWLLTIVKVATAGGGGDATTPLTLNGRPVDQVRSGGALAAFFAFHYGLFTLVHGVFALGMAFRGPGRLHPDIWLLTGLVLLGSHAFSMVVHWFRGGERWRVSAGSAMFLPYPRMMVLHFAIIFGFGLVARADAGDGLRATLPALLLVALKTVADLVLHRWQHRRVAAGAEPVRPT